MSGIYKLSVQGIRSFAPDHAETLQFNRPLTLIVGTNGSGKTTIIECLRYATTGDLPPNSKNGAFVYDPNLSSERVTKAQIKLAFQNVNGSNMVLTKSLQVSKKAGSASLTFKTLENQLVVINKGERTTVSSKITDIEQKVPIHLGVSKAILDYVIFCHQDDNLWPISEPSVLKKRFDEIFDSVKFIKVLDNFKVINKEMNIDIKLLNNNVEHLKNDRNKSLNKLQEIDELQEQVKAYEEEIEKISEQIDMINVEAEKLFTSNQDYEQILSRLELLKQQEFSLEKQIERTEASTDILLDSDEAIQEKLGNFATYLNSKKDEADEIKSVLDDNSKSLSKQTEVRYQLTALQGSLTSKKNDIENKMKQRKEIISKLSEEFSIDSGAGFSNQFKSKVEYLEEAYKTANRVYTSDLEVMDSDLAKLKDTISREEQHLSYIESDYESLKKKNADFQKSVETITMSEGQLTKQKAELEEALEKSNKLKETNEIGEIVSKIAATNSKIGSLEKQVDEINKSISTTTLSGELMSKYNFLKDNKIQIEKSLDEEIEAIKEEFKNVIGTDLDVESCYSETVLRQKEVNYKLREAEEKYKEQTKLKYELEGQISLDSSTVAKFEDELSLQQREVDKVLNEDPIEDYEKILEECESAYHDQLESAKLHSATVKFNTKALQMAESKHSCMLCRRPFDSTGSELEDFLTQLQKNNEILKKQNVQEELDELKKELDSLLSIKNPILSLRNLTDPQGELNTKRETLKRNRTSFNEVAQSLTALEKEISDFKQNSEIISRILEKINEIKRLSNELASYVTDKMPTVEAELIKLGFDVDGDAEFDLECLVEDQTAKNSQIKTLRKELETLNQTKDFKAKESNSLENLIKDKRLSISNLEKTFLDKINIQRTIKDNQEQLMRLEATIKDSKITLATHIAGRDELQTKRDTFVAVEAVKLKTAEEKFKAFSLTYSEFVSIEEAINNYEKKEKSELEKCNIDLAELDIKVEEIRKEIQEDSVKLRNLENEILDANGTERNLRANLDLRGLEKEKTLVQIEIEELDSQQAESKREEYLKESTNLHKKQTKLNAEHASKTGEVIQIEKHIKTIQAELKRDYSDIEDKFIEEYAKLQTKLVMSNDINTYYKALDAAVMSYHSLKMQDINRIIDELWKRTYRGNDVDTIMIRSDPVAATKAASSSMTRSYNYRVVMVKDGTELDMRGRCSAGQKVLASIIIRLALAECLGSNFGMIALDEPTTNLDEENIESLAKALNLIINSRKKQRNFQMIVITHDELFLKHMNAAQFTDHFFKIRRDERLNSEIGQVSIKYLE